MLKQRIKKIYFSRKILLDLSARELKAYYSGSKIYIWWAVINPLILALSINVIFTKALAFTIGIPNYTFFVLSGMIPWIFFSNSVLSATNSLTSHASILKQGIALPEFAPLSVILANFFIFLIGFLVLLPLFIFLEFKVLSVLIFLIFPMILQLIFIIGLGFIFSCWNIFSKDIFHFLFIGLTIWFWVTPVFYSIETLSSPYRWVSLLNPMTYYVILYRQILFEAKPPSIAILGLSFLVSLLYLSVGYSFFLSNEKEILKRV
jgi:ABC-type polysaccharide/polyol phosphate export permease